MREKQGRLGRKEKRVTEGTEERKETGVQLGRRESLAPAHGVEPVERRENQGKRDQRAVQALATKERRESLASLGPPVPPALWDPQLSIQSAATAQLIQEALDPEDQLDHRVPQAPRDNQELMENQVILARMEKLVLRDLQASQEPQETLVLKERRETVERVSLAPGDPQDHRDPQDQDSDLLLWTWKAQGSRIWNLLGDCQAYLVLPVPLGLLVFPVPLQQAQDRVLGHLDHQERTGRLANLACLVCRVLMAFQELLAPREKRVIQASWAFQEQLERRELKEHRAYLDLQERLDWLVCLDPWDLSDHLDLPGLLDQVIVLDLMIWRVLGSPMDFLVPEDQKEDRVNLACQDFRANLGSLVYQARRVLKVLWEETGSQGWMASPDLRDQRVTEETKERGVTQDEMELVSQVHLALLDHQDRSSTGQLAILMVLLAAWGLREDLVYLVKLDSLVLLDQRVTEETLAFQAMESRERKVSQA